MCWNAFAPASWKRGTLKTLVERAYLVCSDDYHLEKELKHLEKVFREKNDYPNHVITQIFQQVFENHNTADENEITTENVPEDDKKELLVVPYQGLKGDFVIKSMKKRLRNLLPSNVKTQIVFTGKKLGTCFQIKEKTKIEHENDIVYHGKCPSDNCCRDYVGETARRFKERVIDHTGRDIQSHLNKHSIETGHETLNIKDYKVIGNGYRNNIFKRKVAEALLIKELKPTLNK